MRPRAAVAALAFILAGSHAVAQQRAELVDRSELRVCADPSDLPFSDQQEQGFENKIADIIAADLKVPVSYVWFPQVIGFVRNTLGAQRCDLVMGTVAGDSVMDTTTPYYHSGYMLVSRADDPPLSPSIGDPDLVGKRIGVIAATPPTDLLVRHGLMGDARTYSLAVDTRKENPSHDMAQDILDKKIDVGLLWGPIAGYFITHEHMKLRAVFIEPEPDAPRLDYRISMGVRVNEPEWRRRINQAIQRHQPEITRVLTQYGVPMLDEQNRPIQP
jgi:quinoprotein dehydrogenase-associated probable ABC transporter substrate-binding protein